MEDNGNNVYIPCHPESLSKRSVKGILNQVVSATPK